ncbi:MAG: zinc transporter ZntB [Rhodospirillales bacterium]
MNDTPDTGNGLITGQIFDGRGGAREIGWSEVEAWETSKDATVLWVHLDRSFDKTIDWIRDKSGINPIIAEALIAAETRPRAVTRDDGVLTILRGVNLNPGAVPEDMVGLRIWIERNRIVSVRFRRLQAIQDIRDELGQGRGPATPGEFLAQIAERLADRIEPVIAGLASDLDALDDAVDASVDETPRHRLRTLRHRAIALRRYLSPQRDALIRLFMDHTEFLSNADKMILHEVGDRMIRYVEELEEAREHALVLQDELFTRLSERMNKTMYLLTVIAAIMLPLSFVTGLLGINVGGIPLADSDSGFAIVCIAMAVIGVVEIWLFKKLRWI